MILIGITIDTEITHVTIIQDMDWKNVVLLFSRVYKTVDISMKPKSSRVKKFTNLNHDEITIMAPVATI